MSFQHRADTCRPTTFDLTEHTIEAIASTGAAVRRPGYTEVLDLAGADLSGLVGAPVLDGHQRNSTRDQLGIVEKAEVRGNGLWVLLRFRENTSAVSVMTDIANGTIRGISIGYSVEEFRDTKGGKVLVRTATKWTPKEVSIVPVPADPGAHFRSGETEMLDIEEAGAVQTRAEQNAEIRSIARLAGMSREWTDGQIDAAATPDAARAAVFTALEANKATTRTSAIQMGVDHSDPNVIATRAGEAL